MILIVEGSNLMILIIIGLDWVISIVEGSNLMKI